MPWRSSSEKLSWLPEKVVPYFGTVENQNVICCTTLRLWQAHGTVATKMSPASPSAGYHLRTSEIMYSRIICVAMTILDGDWIMNILKTSVFRKYLIRNI